MTHYAHKAGATFLKFLPIALVIMVGIAWAEDGAILQK